MKAKIVAAFFALTVIAQLWVPATMIISSEKALKGGKAYRFKTAPIDPYDAFRGKYVTLDFEAATLDSQQYAEAVETVDVRRLYGKRVYAVLGEDTAGFAAIAGFRTAKPSEAPFVPVKVLGFPRGGLRVQFPFSKYFLEEGKASRAERLYREHSRAGKQDCYALVRVGSKGHAVIEDLIFGGVPVMDAVR